MRKVFITTAIAMIGLTLFLGCQKEEGIVQPTLHTQDFLKPENRKGFDFRKDQPALYKMLERKFAENGSRSLSLKITDINFSNYLVMSRNSTEIFTFSMVDSREDRFYNFVLEKFGNDLNHYVLEIKPNFMPLYLADPLHFTGRISKITLENAFSIVSSSISSRDLDDDRLTLYCWDLLFDNGKDLGYFSSGGGNGGAGNNDGSGKIGGSRYGGGSITYGGGGIIYGTGTGGNGGNTDGGSQPGGGTGGGGTDTGGDSDTIVIPPDMAKPLQTNGSFHSYQSQISNRNDTEPCKVLLEQFGIVFPNDDGKLDISEECLKKLDKGAIAELAKMLEANSYVDPCDPTKTSNDIIKNIVENACSTNSGAVTKADLQKVFEEGQKFTFPKDFAAQCPCFAKIINELNISGTENWLCEMVNTIDGTNNFTQKFEIYDGDRIFNRPEPTKFSNATIFIPKSFCGSTAKNLDGTPFNDLDYTSRFIHELMHGYMFSLLKEKYPDKLPDDFYLPVPFDPLSIRYNPKYWNDLVASFSNTPIVSSEQHVLFFTHLKEKINQALHQLNGNKGSSSDYEYYSNILINSQDLTNGPWARQLGLIDENGNVIFNNNNNLNAWNSIGGDSGFNIKCKPQ
jgi:hypothetical protein